MPKKLTWIDYINRLPGNPSDRAIASAIGTNPATLVRWRKGQMPSPKHVTEVARAYDLPPISALVNAGYLTLDEADEMLGGNIEVSVNSLGDYSNLELSSELTRRLRAEEMGD